MKNIVFDMGNVLTKYTLADCIRRYADTEEMFQLMAREVCGSEEWLAMDRGIMTDEEAIASICKRLPYKMYDVVARFIHEFRMEPEDNLSKNIP